MKKVVIIENICLNQSINTFDKYTRVQYDHGISDWFRMWRNIESISPNGQIIDKKVIDKLESTYQYTYKIKPIELSIRENGRKLLKEIGYDNDSITSTEEWIACAITGHIWSKVNKNIERVGELYESIKDELFVKFGNTPTEVHNKLREMRDLISYSNQIN